MQERRCAKKRLAKNRRGWSLVLIPSWFRGSGRLGEIVDVGFFSPYFKISAGLTLFSQYAVHGF